MQVLLCTGNGVCRASELLKKEIETLVPAGMLETVSGVTDLMEYLKRPRPGNKIVILLARDGEELEQYLSIKSMIIDLPLVLILPDLGKNTISRACRLYPRFMSYIESNFMDVATVVRQMLIKTRVIC